MKATVMPSEFHVSRRRIDSGMTYRCGGTQCTFPECPMPELAQAQNEPQK